MREKFDEQLSYLHREMIEMGAQCEEVISLAIDALVHDDVTLIEKVFALEREIDKKEREIESICLRLLLQQQPIASDLREISAALKMISDMERIGDQAAEIAEITKLIGGSVDISEAHIKAMAKDAAKMVTDSIDSFVKLDLDLARSVIVYDDVVDRWFDRIKNELIVETAEKKDIGDYFDLLMVAKYLERIADHATNIAEWVEFSITGERPDNRMITGGK
ncbi:MAG TPA: phosphate signaling complex protein PhoU [Clostridiales bacterium]|nr:phosphate signaling complex protein PhoU [Clostridiales bacterium]